MKVFFDSNVLISAILSKKGMPFLAIQKAGNNGCEMIVSELNIEWPLIMSPAEFVSYYPTPPDNPLYVAEP